MNLHRSGTEWYVLEITTTPAVAAWEASFDGGITWVASTAVGSDGYSRWLVAGPAAAAGTAAVLPVGRTTPLIRAQASPEVVVRSAPPIDVRG